MARDPVSPSVSLLAPHEAVAPGVELTLRAIVRGPRRRRRQLRWQWDDGDREWHAPAWLGEGTHPAALFWRGVLREPGVHRMSISDPEVPEFQAATYVVVADKKSLRLVICGSAVRVDDGRDLVPIGLLLADPDTAELRWSDGEVEVRTRDVTWLLNQPDGWVHMGGIAIGALGIASPFRAHVLPSAPRSRRQGRAEIRLYPPGANPGVDPPQRVIAGQIQALRSRGSTSA